MSDCKQVRDYIYDYVDKQISTDEAEHLLEHLNLCKHCFTQYEFLCLLKRLNQKIGNAENASESLKQRIFSEMDKES